MAQVLYALVVLQGTTLNLSPGYTSVAECTQQYKGPYVSCFAYDPNSAPGRRLLNFRRAGSGPSARLPARTSGASIGAFKDGIPTVAGSRLCPHP